METDILRTFAKFIILAGVFLVITGGIFFLLSSFDLFGGKEIRKLPGDILIKKNNFVFYFPIATSLLLSAIFTLILNFIAKILKR